MMPNTNSDESVLNFGTDSPLFAKKKTVKKKAAKKKIAVPKKAKRKVNPLEGSSPLFVDKEPVKKRGPKSHAQIEEEAIIAENKRVAKKAAVRAKKQTSKVKAKVYPKVTSPTNCKHILPAFKKQLAAKWKLLEDGTLTESSTVASYINGVMAVCKEKRPKEYDELFVLKAIAKKIYNERTTPV